MSRIKQNPRKGVSPLMTERGEMTITDTEKAQVLNSLFSSVFTHEDLSTMPDIDPVDFQEPLTKTEILISEVETELTKMKSDKSPGPDLVLPKVLKTSKPHISCMQTYGKTHQN